MSRIPRYTLVQHSAFTVNRDGTFERAVEVKALSSVPQQRAVQKAGGVLFASWDYADQAEYAANYPDRGDADPDGLVPGVRGTFGPEVDGQPVYVPAPGEDFAVPLVGVA